MLSLNSPSIFFSKWLFHVTIHQTIIKLLNALSSHHTDIIYQ